MHFYENNNIVINVVNITVLDTKKSVYIYLFSRVKQNKDVKKNKIVKTVLHPIVL